MNGNLTKVLLGRLGKSNRQTARVIKTVSGRYVLQSYEAMSVIQQELTGRPDGIRPSGAESTLELLRSRQHDAGQSRIKIFPQDWMELDREFSLYQQRRKLSLSTATDAHHHGDMMTAARLYRRAAADAWHCLEIIDFADQLHPAKQLSAARAILKPSLLAQQYMANSQLRVLENNPDSAVACLRAGITEVAKLLSESGDANPMANACIRDMQAIEEAVRQDRESGQKSQEEVSDSVFSHAIEQPAFHDGLTANTDRSAQQNH